MYIRTKTRSPQSEHNHGQDRVGPLSAGYSPVHTGKHQRYCSVIGTQKLQNCFPHMINISLLSLLIA